MKHFTKFCFSLSAPPPYFFDKNLPFAVENTRYSSKKRKVVSVQLYKALRKYTKLLFL
jgi:hypothetical protein